MVVDASARDAVLRPTGFVLLRSRWWLPEFPGVRGIAPVCLSIVCSGIRKRLSASLPPSPGDRPTCRWLGKNSTQNKLGRQLGEIQIRMRLRVSGDKREIRQSYLPTLVPRLVSPLVEHGTEGVQEVIELMDQYYLSKEEWDAIVEMGIGEGMSVEQVLKSIPTATKSAFTRKCVFLSLSLTSTTRVP